MPIYAESAVAYLDVTYPEFLDFRRGLEARRLHAASLILTTLPLLSLCPFLVYRLARTLCKYLSAASTVCAPPGSGEKLVEKYLALPIDG
jgi:hypothetical protein